jgi:hypothetical protein
VGLNALIFIIFPSLVYTSLRPSGIWFLRFYQENGGKNKIEEKAQKPRNMFVSCRSHFFVNLDSVSILFYSRHVVVLDQFALAACDTENEVVER